jgi:hypothetical protein
VTPENAIEIGDIAEADFRGRFAQCSNAHSRALTRIRFTRAQPFAEHNGYKHKRSPSHNLHSSSTLPDDGTTVF